MHNDDDEKHAQTINVSDYYDVERTQKIVLAMKAVRGELGEDTMAVPEVEPLPHARVEARARRWIVECFEAGSGRTSQPFFSKVFGPGQYKIGRDHTICPIKTGHEGPRSGQVSRVHAVLVLGATNGRRSIKDLESKNGTLIRGIPIEKDLEVDLGSSAGFVVGSVEVRVRELATSDLTQRGEPEEKDAPVDGK